jgi:hypothetical protein
MLTLSGLIWNLVMKDRSQSKLVLFDEVWTHLMSPSSAQLIGELYRTTRKYNCSILTLSQSVEDFTASPIAPALVNNAATVYLLRHAKGHRKIAAELNLNAREQVVFESLEMRRGEYSEVLVLHGKRHFLSRVVLSPLEYWIATTYPPDLALESRYVAKYPTLSRLELLSKLAVRYPRGAQAEEPNRA